MKLHQLMIPPRPLTAKILGFLSLTRQGQDTHAVATPLKTASQQPTTPTHCETAEESDHASMKLQTTTDSKRFERAHHQPESRLASSNSHLLIDAVPQ